MKIDIKPIYDFVHVEVNGIYEDSTFISGPDGQKIKLALTVKNYETNVSGAEEKRTRSGIVRYVCRKVNDKHVENYLYSATDGFPAYAESRRALAYNREVEVDKGDKVYFHYLSLSNETLVEKTPQGTEIHAIRYKNVFCYVRDGQITMVNGHVLLDPTYEGDVQDIEVEGKTIKAIMSDSGLVANAAPKKEKDRALLAFIGKPVLPFTTDAKVGDIVKLGRHQNKKYMVEGKEYYVSQQWKLLAKEVEGSTFPFANMVIVKPVHKKYAIEVDTEKLPITKGIVVSKGALCTKEYSEGDIIHFPEQATDKRWADGVVLVKEDQIYLVGDADIQIQKEGRFVKV